jgi:hypothetical protein
MMVLAVFESFVPWKNPIKFSITKDIKGLKDEKHTEIRSRNPFAPSMSNAC